VNTLARKLGLKEGLRVKVINSPPGYLEPFQLKVARIPPYEFLQIFLASAKMLEALFPKLAMMITKDGSLWVSWPKGSDKINENIIREIGLKNGLVDVKVVSVDEVWSGLKFVYRVKDRA
jgi:hypothetical protein